MVMDERTLECAEALVTARMKRSGQSWGHGALTFRSLLKSRRFDWAWPPWHPA